MVKLEPFKEEDFERLISWVDNEEELIQFAGSIFSYPLTKDQLKVYISSTERVPLKIKLIDSDEIIGHCELNYSNEIPRLSRIIIGRKDLRNKGLGKAIVKRMTEMIYDSKPYNSVELAVFDWNLNAINCYKSLGFFLVNGSETITKINNKEWRSFIMRLNKIATTI